MVIMCNSSRYVTSGIKAGKTGKQLAWLCVKVTKTLFSLTLFSFIGTKTKVLNNKFWLYRGLCAKHFLCWEQGLSAALEMFYGRF